LGDSPAGRFSADLPDGAGIRHPFEPLISKPIKKLHFGHFWLNYDAILYEIMTHKVYSNPYDIFIVLFSLKIIMIYLLIPSTSVKNDKFNLFTNMLILILGLFP